MSDDLTPQGRQRAGMLMRYYATLEAGNIDELATVLHEAESDPYLQNMLLETNALYQEENRQTILPQEFASIHNLIQQYTQDNVAHNATPMARAVASSVSWQSRAQAFWKHLWLVLISQARLIHKSVWVVCLLTLGISGALAWYLIGLSAQLISGAEVELALMISVTTASGIAFLCGAERDAGQEIVVSTPTSQSLILCCRTALVVGYNILLAFVLSLVLSATHGISLLEITQIWLGPILLLASLGMAFTVVVGSLYALFAVLLMEVVQMLQIRFSGSTVLLAHNYLWQTNAMTLLLAGTCFLFALFYVSRYPRLGSEVA